jgi:hypothetical protein
LRLRASDAAAHERGGLVPVDPPAGEPFERRLVAGGDRDVGAGLEVGGVHAPDGFGVLDEHLRRPQRIPKVGAAAFELGGESAVEHDGSVLLDDASERLDHGSSLRG